MVADCRCAGLSIKRPDDFFTAQGVMADIWTALLETKLVIADCTGRNPNVFYELGWRMLAANSPF